MKTIKFVTVKRWQTPVNLNVLNWTYSNYSKQFKLTEDVIQRKPPHIMRTHSSERSVWSHIAARTRAASRQTDIWRALDMDMCFVSSNTQHSTTLCSWMTNGACCMKRPPAPVKKSLAYLLPSAITWKPIWYRWCEPNFKKQLNI